MKQHFLSMTEDPYLYERAVLDCFKGKWRRNDVLSFIEKYAGIPRHEILLNELELYEDRFREREHNHMKVEAIQSCGLALSETIAQILDGEAPEDVEPPKIRKRPDGMTGKVRDIALLSIMHQLIEHTAFLLLQPLLEKKLYQTQHASIPKHGQTRLKDQIHKYLRSDLHIRYFVKTDMKHAYASVQYNVVVDLLKKDIPSATHIIKVVEYLGKIAPDGHLIIGGYLDAWLFNYVMSKIMTKGYSIGYVRRGKFKRCAIRIVTFMDDMWISASSIKSIKKILRVLEKYASDELHMTLKITTGISKLLTIEEENRRRCLTGAKRGCPVVDMGGYKISRSHVVIRRRVFIRVRRQLIRAWRDYERNGTIGIQRAFRLISYNGYLKQTNSENLIERYHVPLLMYIAKRVVAFHARLAFRKRTEKLNDLRERTIIFAAAVGGGRKSAGWPAENYHFQRYLGNTRRRRNTIPVQRSSVQCTG